MFEVQGAERKHGRKKITHRMHCSLKSNNHALELTREVKSILLV